MWARKRREEWHFIEPTFGLMLGVGVSTCDKYFRRVEIYKYQEEKPAKKYCSICGAKH